MCADSSTIRTPEQARNVSSDDLQMHSAGKAFPRKLSILLLLWTASVFGWFFFLESYSNTPGAGGLALEHWPVDSSISRSGDRPTLLMFFHPRCPCSTASMGELERLVAISQGLADIRAVFVRPEGTPCGWEQSDLWNLAKRIPDVQLSTDALGVEAKRFGALTSGEVRLYDTKGRLLFCGGITGARGHAGDNAGSAAVFSWLHWGTAGRARTFTFGCPLFELRSECARKGATCKH